MNIQQDPLINARTELTVTQDDLRASQRALERERTRVDGVRDRLRRDGARQAAAVAYVNAVHGPESANTVRDILAGTHSHQPAADTDGADHVADLRTARQLAAQVTRGAADATSATELAQALIIELDSARDRLHETLRQLADIASRRRHAAQELALIQSTLTTAANDTLTRLRDDYAATVELIRAELEDSGELTMRECYILGLIHETGGGENADRSRSELAQAENTVAQLRRDYPADVR